MKFFLTLFLISSSLLSASEATNETNNWILAVQQKLNKFTEADAEAFVVDILARGYVTFTQGNKSHYFCRASIEACSPKLAHIFAKRTTVEIKENYPFDVLMQLIMWEVELQDNQSTQQNEKIVAALHSLVKTSTDSSETALKWILMISKGYGLSRLMTLVSESTTVDK